MSHAARQLHADHAAFQEEQRIGRLPGADDALAGFIAAGRREFCEHGDFVGGQIRQQRLLARWLVSFDEVKPP
jgi:hypothetical protein